MKPLLLTTIITILSIVNVGHTGAFENSFTAPLSDLKNFQVNNPKMVSAGLPNQAQFETLKTMGVTKVIDLIPGDRAEEIGLMKSLNLTYHNIQVEWANPTIKNFQDYVASMQQSKGNEGIILTHCRLNWRGAVFTYLYRVTVLNESEKLAKQDMLAIWEPNETWQEFIEEVIGLHNKN